MRESISTIVFISLSKFLRSLERELWGVDRLHHETLGSIRPWECEACHAPSDSFIGHRDCATCAERRPAHDWPSSSKLYGWCNLRGLNHASVSELGGSSRLMIAGGRLTKVCSNAGAALVPAAIIPRVTIAPSTDRRMLIGMIASIHTGDIVPPSHFMPAIALASCAGYLTNYQTPCVQGHVCECVQYPTVNRSWLDCRDYGRVKSKAY